MTDKTHRPRGVTRLVLAASALIVLGVASTSAAFTDHAVVNLGTGSPGSGVGNPNRFDIAIHDDDDVLQDADTRATAVVLSLTSGTALSETDPVVFDATVLNRDPGVAGDLSIQLYDPDPVTDDVFAALRFTIYLDGSPTASLTGLTSTEVNAAGLTITDVEPGEEHTIRVSAVLASGTALGNAGKTTQVGLQVEGESR
ncbi:hypothetical protein [Propionicicella superfundia]|uniref:hypothetical protein n=1 Tax=Propionicicella superfundia TaxID=348582 RepID=UPI0003F5E124|nr:hypothetical protein [Propionicicella superfundia]